MSKRKPKAKGTKEKPSSVQRIASEARRFRDAIERCDRAALPFRLQAFPRRACGDTTDILGEYLTSLGLGSFLYISGTKSGKDKEITHAWLLQGKLIVDITADQFPEVSDRVIVTERSPWHEGWKQTDGGMAKLRDSDDELKSVYQLVCSLIGKSSA
jgi:hypothetical protein